MLDFHSPTFLHNPYPTYQKIHELGGVYRCQQSGTYFVGGYDLVKAQFKNTALSVGTLRANHKAWPQPRRRLFAPVISLVDKCLVFRDAPEHTRIRRVINAAFSAAILSDLQPTVEQLAAKLVGDMKFPEYDIAGDLAYPLPVLLICKFLGIPDEERANIIEWSRDLASYIDGHYDQQRAKRIVASAIAGCDMFLRIIREQRQRCTAGIYESLFELQALEPGITDDHLVSQLFFMVVAGHETTTSSINNCIYQLIACAGQLPSQTDLLADVGQVVDECMRLESPVQRVYRLAAGNTEINGVLVPKGARVALLMAAANRDPHAFQEPDQFRLGRDNADKHLAFGYGPHYCVGSQLAKNEVRSAVRFFLQRFELSRLQIVGHEWQQHANLRGAVRFSIREVG